MAFCFSGQERDEALSLNIARDWNAGELEHRGKNINEFDEGFRALVRLYPVGAAYQQGAAHGGFVTAMFLKTPVLAQHVTVVAGENDQGVLGLAGLFERSQNQADIF